jgi:hypothetical protein
MCHFLFLATTGFALGCANVLLPSLASDLFGLGSFGAVYNALQGGCIAGAVLLSTVVAEYL